MTMQAKQAHPLDITLLAAYDECRQNKCKMHTNTSLLIHLIKFVICYLTANIKSAQ